MHIKFLAHGTGDPKLAIGYLLASHDYKGILRPQVAVLRGDPQQVAMVVDSLPQLHRYTSGVIAWAHEDAPRPDEVDAVLDDFERIAFAGLSPGRFSYTAINHGSHVHLFIAKVDLLTCKSFNVAPPGWKSDFYPLRDYWNFKKGWARPDDPNRARFLSLPLPRFKPELAKRIEEDLAMGHELVDIHAALDVEPEPEFLIAQWLVDLIYEGKILTHQDVFDKLSKEGRVTQVSRSTLSFVPLGSEQAIKLCGRLFSKDFNAQEVFDRIAIREMQWAGREEPNLVAAHAAFQRMMIVIERRSQYNLRVYKTKTTRAVQRDQQAKAVSIPVPPLPTRDASIIARRAWHALAAAKVAIEQCAIFLKKSLHSAAQATGFLAEADSIRLKRALEAKTVIHTQTNVLTSPKSQTSKQH